MATEQKEYKPKVVDWSNPRAMADGEVRKIDVTNLDDAWGRSAPPRKGFYKLQMQPLAKDAVLEVLEDPTDPKKGMHYEARVDFQITSDDPEINGTYLSEFTSTLIKPKKEASTMAAVIGAFGISPVPKGQTDTTDKQLVLQLIKVANQSPITKKPKLVNWKATYKEANGRWSVPYKDWDMFPDDPAHEGEKLYEVDYINNERQKVTLTAKAWIDWKAKEIPGTSGAKTAKVEPEVIEMEEATAPTPTPIRATGVAKKQTPKPVEPEPEVTDDDLGELEDL